jgi:hypothetical protein
MFIKFSDTEIHGKEWSPPVLRTVAMLQRAFSEIRESSYGPLLCELGTCAEELQLRRCGDHRPSAGIAPVRELLVQDGGASVVHRRECHESDCR